MFFRGKFEKSSFDVFYQSRFQLTCSGSTLHLAVVHLCWVGGMGGFPLGGGGGGAGVLFI